MSLTPTDNATSSNVFIRSELALNPATGDMLIPPKLLRGADAVAQRVSVRFKWFLGEWFLDQNEGMPWFEQVLVKNPDTILVSFLFKRVLTRTPGVKAVTSFVASLHKATRELTVDFEATLLDGSPLKFQDEKFTV